MAVDYRIVMLPESGRDQGLRKLGGTEDWGRDARRLRAVGDESR